MKEFSIKQSVHTAHNVCRTQCNCGISILNVELNISFYDNKDNQAEYMSVNLSVQYEQNKNKHTFNRHNVLTQNDFVSCELFDVVHNIYCAIDYTRNKRDDLVVSIMRLVCSDNIYSCTEYVHIRELEFHLRQRIGNDAYIVFRDLYAYMNIDDNDIRMDAFRVLSQRKYSICTKVAFEQKKSYVSIMFSSKKCKSITAFHTVDIRQTEMPCICGVCICLVHNPQTALVYKILNSDIYARTYIVICVSLYTIIISASTKLLYNKILKYCHKEYIHSKQKRKKTRRLELGRNENGQNCIYVRDDCTQLKCVLSFMEERIRIIRDKHSVGGVIHNKLHRFQDDNDNDVSYSPDIIVKHDISLEPSIHKDLREVQSLCVILGANVYDLKALQEKVLNSKKAYMLLERRARINYGNDNNIQII